MIAVDRARPAWIRCTNEMLYVTDIYGSFNIIYNNRKSAKTTMKTGLIKNAIEYFVCIFALTNEPMVLTGSINCTTRSL